jgi:PAS domain S-box-containing protein
VLVLDDREADRQLMRVVLGHAGHTVHEASHGDQALALALALPERPDLIITDLLMPGMDGYEFVEELRSHPETASIPVIFCTATYAPEEVESLASACGVARILVKPVEPEEIIRTVADVLGTTPELESPVSTREFKREHQRVLNAKLLAQIDELERSNRRQQRLLTERHEADLLRSVVMDAMAEGLYVVDGDGCLSLMNAAASRLLGWTEDELRGQRAHDTLNCWRADGSRCPESESDLLRVRAAGETVRRDDAVLTRKDGALLPVAYSAVPLALAAGARGAVIVFRDITDECEERTRMQRELEELIWVGRTRDALDEGRLVLYAQPIVPLANDDPEQESEELLLRMIGRDGEIIAPGRFLPAAERYGLIREIDRWVVTQAIARAACGTRVEANLSAESIVDSELLAFIENELDRARADPTNIVFELTETALTRDFEAAERFAHGIVALGCGLALDDFGTGFGSFNYLKRLPVKILKIDIEFVRDLDSNPANQKLVQAIVSLARGFGHDTVAEGVEDERTLELLRGYGVDYAQGFHIGRPAAIEATTLL